MRDVDLSKYLDRLDPTQPYEGEVRVTKRVVKNGPRIGKVNYEKIVWQTCRCGKSRWSRIGVSLCNKCACIERERVAHIDVDVSLDEQTKQNLDGLLLGDGYVEKVSRYSARYVHTTSRLETLDILKDLLPFESNIKKKITPGHFKRTGEWIRSTTSYQMRTKPHGSLVSFLDRWYSRGKKHVPLDLKLTPLVCYWWYIGDGSLHNKVSETRTSGLALCTNGFDDDDHKFLIERLVIDVGLQRVSVDKRGVLHFYAENIPKFLNYIGPCKNPEYAYKWDYTPPSMFLNRMADEELPKTREEAVRIDCVAYFTGEACKHGHVSRRYAKSGRCYVCANERRMLRRRLRGDSRA